MIRLETNDLSKAPQIMRHPEICRATGLDPNGPVYPQGPDRCTILVMDNDEPVGYIGFVFDKRQEVAETTVAVLSEYRGSEFKTACEAAISSMFVLGFKTLTARIPSTNIPALSGARIFGFLREREQNGVVKLALTREKWAQTHPQMRN